MKGFRVTGLLAGLALVSVIVGSGYAQAPLPVVPGASGFGMETRAAYGGSASPTILRVTNLNDSGAGSLRAAIQATGPRVIIFETSGTIGLSSDLVISSPYVTVAGQTAPSPGITVRNYGVIVNTNDVLLQHFRVRPGPNSCNNGVQAWGSTPYNIVLDHMSVSWGQDENIVVYNPSRPINATIWRTISAEGLYRAAGSSGCSGGGLSNGHGLLVYASTQNVSVMQTLFANNIERNPYMQSGTRTVLMNNLIYNFYSPWGIFFSSASTTGTADGPAWVASAVGNRFVGGPSTYDAVQGGACAFSYSIAYGNVPGNRIYRSGNTVVQGGATGPITDQCNNLSYDPNVGNVPAEAPLPQGYTPLASTAMEGFLLDNDGARPADRDGVDARIIQEVRSRTGRFISSPTEVGGWPTLAANPRSLTVPTNPHTTTASGYTALEVWLHGYSAAVERSTQTTLSAPTALHLIY